MPLATGQIAQILPKKKTATWPSCGRQPPLPYSICRSCNFNWTTDGYHTVGWYGYHLSAPSNYIKQLRHISLILRQEKSNKKSKRHSSINVHQRLWRFGSQFQVGKMNDDDAHRSWWWWWYFDVWVQINQLAKSSTAAGATVGAASKVALKLQRDVYDFFHV